MDKATVRAAKARYRRELTKAVVAKRDREQVRILREQDNRLELKR